ADDGRAQPGRLGRRGLPAAGLLLQQQLLALHRRYLVPQRLAVRGSASRSGELCPAERSPRRTPRRVRLLPGTARGRARAGYGGGPHILIIVDAWADAGRGIEGMLAPGTVGRVSTPSAVGSRRSGSAYPCGWIRRPWAGR